MKLAYLITTLMIFSQIVTAEPCQVFEDKMFFQDQEGEFIPQGKGKEAKKIYPVFTKFQADYPTRASLNIPFKGNCENLKVKKVKVYRALGANQLAGDQHLSEKNDHNQHGNEVAGIQWDEKPIFEGEKSIRVTTRNIILSSFDINEMANTAPKKKHIWRYKFIVIYQKDDKKLQSFTKIFHSPLIH
ncbi:hypothetical protein OAT67_04280 [Bacteriovoracaceae bacterium]|nr:hypothetical protein [Bacteriovoracaceae bacterium]